VSTRPNPKYENGDNAKLVCDPLGSDGSATVAGDGVHGYSMPMQHKHHTYNVGVLTFYRHGIRK
jgi:hypothetical protein